LEKPDPGWIRDPGWGKSGCGSRDKHPASATLLTRKINFLYESTFMRKYLELDPDLF